MSLTANIKLRKVTYLQLLLSSMRDKSESLRKL
jgi:HlyD family secretion protein